MTQDMHTKFALTARHQGLQNQLTFQSHRKITCYLVMWFLMQLRSCDFVGAIHDRVTNDAGAAEPARCSTLATIPTLILQSLPSSTLPNRLDFKPTGKTFLGQMIIQAVPGSTSVGLFLFCSEVLRNLSPLGHLPSGKPASKSRSV